MEPEKNKHSEDDSLDQSAAEADSETHAEARADANPGIKAGVHPAPGNPGNPGNPGAYDTLDAPKGDTNMAMLCHLLSFVGFIGVPFGNVLGPLVLWLIKKDEDALVDATGKEVINFQISAFIYGIVCAILILVFIGIVLLPILIIAVIIYTIIGAIKASEGQLYRYPFTIRFIK